MIHKYKSYVDKENIAFHGEPEKDLRYLLEIPLKIRSDKSILVIMKNPSKANQRKSDLTINRVLKFCYNHHYRKVYIMNLYAYYSTDSNRIASLIKTGKELHAIGKDNDKILKEYVQKVDEVIVGWGSNTFNCTAAYKNRIKQVTEIVRDKKLYSVQSVSKCGWYPRHGQIWSVNSHITMAPWEPPF